MSDMLIRGLPPTARRSIEEIAHEENLSLNQIVIRLIQEAIEQKRKAEEDEEQREKVFRRLDAIRERLHRKYGTFDDSTKLIREDRDSR